MPDEPAQETKVSSETYPVTFKVAYPQQQSRVLALLSLPFFLARLILLIPQIIVLYFLQIVAFIAAWLNMWMILFTGQAPPGRKAAETE